MSGCVMATSVWGPMLIPVQDAYVAQAILKDGVYSAEEWRSWVPYLAYGHHVVEVGTHCGAFTLAFARAVGHRGKVVGFEPQMGLAQMANGTLALNGLWHGEVRPMAVGASVGVLHMARRTYAAHGNYGAIEGVEEGAGEPVPRTTLDQESLVRCDFLKVDVEGAEYAVLTGGKQLIRRCRPVICCEADRKDANAKVFGWLRNMGYRLYWQTPLLGPAHPDTHVINVLAVTDDHATPVGLLEVASDAVWPT